jgi:general secretion pathway protein G
MTLSLRIHGQESERSRVRSEERCSGLQGSVQSRVRGNGCRSGRGGFTIIELMIVLAIIAILAAVAVGNYQHSIWRAREAVLRNDLFTLRSSIDQYTLDKQKAPQSLDDLATAGYIKTVPKDPITNEPDWVTVQEDTLMAIDQTQPGIVDVHSASSNVSTDGSTYNTW